MGLLKTLGKIVLGVVVGLFDYPVNRNRFGYWLTKLMESAGDTIRDIPKILQAFSFEYTEEEIGGLGSVHLYIARKRTNV